VWGEGDFAYLGSFAGSGVAIIDLSDPENPFLAATYLPASGGQFKDVKVDGGVGYFASDNGGGVHIVDLSDPTMPSLLSQVSSNDSGFDDIHNVFVRAGYLYEADSRTGTLKVFDVSDPENPFFVRDIVTPGPSFIHDISVIGSRLFASGFGGSTYIYDVSQVGTTAPPLLGSVPSGSNSHSSWATSDGNLLIIAREIADGDVRIYDVSSPASPVLLSTIDRDSLGIAAHSPHNPVLFDDGLLFISWYQAGVQVIDISDPTNPVRIGDYDTFVGAVSGFDGNWGVYPLLGLDRVLASDLDGGLFVLDASGLVPQVPALGAGARLLLMGMLMFAAALPRSTARSRS
jgi:choice-of-anchor B domain-containing protein